MAGSHQTSDASFVPMFGCFAVVLLGVFAAFLAYTTAASRWPTVEATVVSSRVSQRTETSSTRSGREVERTVYEPAVRYAYIIGGREYVGDALSVTRYADTSPDPAAAVVERYPVGRTIRVHVNPKVPKQSLVSARLPAFFWVVLLLGLGCLFVALRFLPSLIGALQSVSRSPS